MTTPNDYTNVIHCTYLREEGEHIYLIGDDDTEYQVQKSSVNLSNFPCTIHGKGDNGEPVLFIVTADNDPMGDEMQCQETTARWNDVNTRLLLAWYPELKKKVITNILPTKRRMWEEMSRRFQDNGVDLSAQQVENRWKTLDRRYRRALKYSSNRSNAFTYFNEVHEIVQQFAGYPSKKGRKQRKSPEPAQTREETILYSDSDAEMGSDTGSSDQMVVNPGKRTRPDTTSLSLPVKKLKVQSVSRELALMRQAFVQRQARKDAFDELKENNRNKRHQEEMAVLSAIVEALSRNQSNPVEPALSDG